MGPRYSHDQVTRISKTDRTTALPLSTGQLRLWFLSQMKEAGSGYCDTYAIRFDGRLNVRILEKTFNEVIRRHDAMRMSISLLDGHPVQSIHRVLDTSIPVIDCRSYDGLERDRRVREEGIAANREVIDLTSYPLWRIKLLRISDRDNTLLLTIHHVIGDGWSQLIFFHEVAKRYKAYLEETTSTFPELPIGYGDYCLWERPRQERDELNKQLIYWEETLCDAPTITCFPGDLHRPSTLTFEGAGESVWFSNKLSDDIKELAVSECTEGWIVLLAVLKILLYIRTGQEDLVIGYSSSNRTREETKQMIGMFVNAVAIRCTVEANPTILEIIRQVNKGCHDAKTNEEVGLPTILSRLRLKRDFSRNPLFQTFVLQEFYPRPVCIDSLTISHFPLTSDVSRFDLELWIAQEASEGTEQSHARCLGVHFQRNRKVYSEKFLSKLIRDYKALVERVIKDPSANIGSLNDIVSCDKVLKHRSPDKNSLSDSLLQARRKVRS